MSSPRYDWWGYVKAIIRRYPRLKDVEVSGNAFREKEAVKLSVEQTEAMENGETRLSIIDMVFWKQTHTLAGAAMAIPCSERTARRWHTEFIKTVAKNYGLLD